MECLGSNYGHMFHSQNQMVIQWREQVFENLRISSARILSKTSCVLNDGFYLQFHS